LEGHQPTDCAQLDYLEADHLIEPPSLSTWVEAPAP